MKRLIAEVDDSIHNELKKYAVDKNKTVKEIITNLVKKLLKK